MSNVLETYYQLILKDKKYFEEYILNKTTEDAAYNFVKREIEECFIWRKAKDYRELESIVRGKNAPELLRIEAYYYYELCESIFLF